jgi:hypothetical protein
MQNNIEKFPASKLTIQLIATGLMKLSDQTGRGRPIYLPYPTSLQRGLDKLGLECIRQGHKPVQGVPELLDWCRQPFDKWPLSLDLEEIGPGDKLLDDQIPTATCEAWACLNPDVEAELSEQQLMLSVMALCRAAGRPESYSAFRRLLIEQPVLTQFELLQKKSELTLYPVLDQLVEAYQPAPLHCLAQDGKFYICQSCGNLLALTPSGELICEDETCRLSCGPARTNLNTLLAQSKNKSIRYQDEVFWLKRGLRRFVTAPGRAEIRLYNRLTDLGIEVELWPNFDAYDLGIKFNTGEVWAIDVKDWANPFLLAQKVKPLPEQPYWNLAFFVFPDEKLKERPDYIRAFKNNCSFIGGRYDAVVETILIERALQNNT